MLEIFKEQILKFCFFFYLFFNILKRKKIPVFRAGIWMLTLGKGLICRLPSAPRFPKSHDCQRLSKAHLSQPKGSAGSEAWKMNYLVLLPVSRKNNLGRTFTANFNMVWGFWVPHAWKTEAESVLGCNLNMNLAIGFVPADDFIVLCVCISV